VILPLAHVGGGTLEPLQVAVPLAAGAAYLVRARTLAGQGRAVPPERQAAFAIGLALVVAALVSPAAHLGEELLLAHMAQHLLMADIGALLIVLGLTGPVLQPLLATRFVDRLRVLTHPAVALPLWVANLYLWHLPLLYEGALANEVLHTLQHATFVAFGINMWIALLGPLPAPEWFGNGARLGYVVAVRLAGALLANVLMWSEAVLYPDYAAGEAEWGVTALNDQATAGVIMMVEGSILTIVLFGWLFLKAAGEAEERQQLLELAARNGVELSERRAARAVGAGRGAELRRRVEQAAGSAAHPPGADAAGIAGSGDRAPARTG
jgi:cytochrome c oxidase assembly factor CtaG